MNKLNIAFCGCTVNSGSYIENEINNILKLKSLFFSADIIIYENDSIDNTKNVLKSLENKNKIHLISENDIKNKLKHRTMIIAHGRNKLVQKVLLNNKYDYMIMVDLDNVMKKFNKEGLIKAFSYDLKSWDALTGNCKNRYYDIWALRLNENNWTSLHSKLWKKCLDYDCWDMLTHKANIGLNEKNIHIKSYQVNIPDDFNLIQVDSAFNGIGIYKVSKINKCKYVGFTQFCSCEKYNCKFGPCTWAKCEHVSFHADMVKKNNAKIFICPQLIIKDQPEHLL